jgi:hypothetical protein
MKLILILLLTAGTLLSQQFSTDKNHYYIVKHSDYDKDFWLGVINNGEEQINDENFVWRFSEKGAREISWTQEAPAIQNDGQVVLTLPKRDFFIDLAYLPYPQVEFPLEVGDSIYVEQTVPNVNGSSDNIKVSGYLKVISLDKLNIKGRVPNDIMKKWTLEVHSFENLKYKATYVYSNAIGFEKMTYYLDGKVIEIIHKTTVDVGL